MTHAFFRARGRRRSSGAFVTYAVAALAMFLISDRSCKLTGFAQAVSHPSIAELSLYVTILGLLTVLF